ncbi:DUF3558 domain-containing protein [Rhodococcus koreensis]|uniref:DUF3558 domain-containing protein n=1 Tax=Rhodococcus sp. T2V TaxID=3034164 RepID=UPI0023E2A7E5|nr:DUF3558 domain-containing protein [Rhodococcus sp. T2V]MDF3306317.1 DUF3558 domain-containing protein [Rhodococcus sp. T2V]
MASLGTVAAACTTGAEGAAAHEDAPVITYQPCDGIPADATAQARIDAQAPVRENDTNPTSNSCRYLDSDLYYGVVISARAETVQDIEESGRFQVLSETEIGGRRTLVSDFHGGSACTVSVDVDPGVLEIMIGYSELEDFRTVDAACGRALEVATTLSPHFPDHL